MKKYRLSFDIEVPDKDDYDERIPKITKKMAKVYLTQYLRDDIAHEIGAYEEMKIKLIEYGYVKKDS